MLMMNDESWCLDDFLWLKMICWFALIYVDISKGSIEVVHLIAGVFYLYTTQGTQTPLVVQLLDWLTVDHGLPVRWMMIVQLESLATWFGDPVWSRIISSSRFGWWMIEWCWIFFGRWMTWDLLNKPGKKEKDGISISSLDHLYCKSTCS